MGLERSGAPRRVRRVRARRGEIGQTAAELAGVLALLAVIFAALATTDVGEAVAGGAQDAVCRILGGDCDAQDGPQAERLAGQPIAGQDITILPFPGYDASACGEQYEGTCEPQGPGVAATGDVKHERTPTTLDGEGCPQQTASVETTFQLGVAEEVGANHGKHAKPSKPEGRLALYLARANQYAITAAPDQMDAMQKHERPLINPLDPRSMQPGEAVQMSQEFYAHAGLDADYRAMQASLGYDRGRRVSAGATRIDGKTMRVYAGDEDFVRNALSLGAGGVSVGFGQELAEGKLRAVDIDVTTPGGWAAYQNFALSGRVPAKGAAGTTDPTTAITHKASQSASIEAQFGSAKLGALLSDSEGNYQQTRHEDGRIEHDLTIRHDDVGLAVKVLKTANGAEQRSYALNLQHVEPDVYENFQKLNFGDAKPPEGGNMRMEFSGDQLMGIRRQALEHIAFSMERAGVQPRPTADQVADNLGRNHGTIKAPNGQEIDVHAIDAQLAVARDPEEVLSRLYRMANGSSHDFLTGPLTEFILRTNTANGDEQPSERSRLPAATGGADC